MVFGLGFVFSRGEKGRRLYFGCGLVKVVQLTVCSRRFGARIFSHVSSVFSAVWTSGSEDGRRVSSATSVFSLAKRLDTRLLGCTSGLNVL